MVRSVNKIGLGLILLALVFGVGAAQAKEKVKAVGTVTVEEDGKKRLQGTFSSGEKSYKIVRNKKGIRLLEAAKKNPGVEFEVKGTLSAPKSKKNAKKSEDEKAEPSAKVLKVKSFKPAKKTSVDNKEKESTDEE